MDHRQVQKAVANIIGPAFLVGGSVRDVVMGREGEDFDFATPLDPDAVESAIRRAGRKPYVVGKRFGTVGFSLQGHKIEVTTFRAQSFESSARKPSVEFVDRLEEDLAHRDFTFNAMAMDGERVVDPYGGREDIRAGVVRAVGSARERFREDPLRMMRAARFVAQFGFEVEPETREAAVRMAHRVLSTARERWVVELDRLLVSQHAAAGLRFLADVGLLRFVLPEVQLQVGFDQDSPYHELELFEHTLRVVEATPPEAEQRWAALLHDVGKPFVQTPKGDRCTYVHHDAVGAEIVEKIAGYLKWGNARTESVRTLVSEHMQTGSPLRAADDAAKR